jgi:hypothetical protein
MKNKGIITSYVLVFGAIFLILIGGVFNFILFQLKQGTQRVAWHQSLAIAEAGIYYYRWCLNNEAEANCSLEKDYFDLEGNQQGSFSLQVTSEIICGRDVRKTIVSAGRTLDFPDLEREVSATYAKISVAQYAYLLNDNVWAGADREIRGLYHSNGGIRMDGESQSLTTSAQETWLCTSSFGCDSSDCPSDCTSEGNACRCPGVFTTTSNSNPDLFEYPVTYFDFDGITVDLAEIKTLTSPYPQNKYWPPVTDIDANGKGYHLILQQDGTADVWIITGLTPTLAYSLQEGWHYDYFSISSEYFYKTITLDPSCSLVFFEDDLWIEGKIQGRGTIVSANLINPVEPTQIVLPDNIEYTTLDGSDGLGVISQTNILISPDSPDVMELKGIFVAQQGRFGRNYYLFNIKDSLEIYGSIVSNDRVGTSWSAGSWIVSGYLKRENYIDPKLVYNPPPFIPSVSSDFKILEWEEVE